MKKQMWRKNFIGLILMLACMTAASQASDSLIHSFRKR